MTNYLAEPPQHCWTILQDHGLGDGGWGPAAIGILGGDTPRPVFYTRSDDATIEAMVLVCKKIAQDTGKPTRLVRFSQREDVFVVGGSS